MLFSRKPGAIAPAEPKVFWVKCLAHPDDSKAMCYNDLLNRALINKKLHYIVDIRRFIDFEDHWFSNFSDEITSDGRIHFWEQLDKVVQQYENKEISLKALEPPQHKSTQKEHEKDQRYRMPPPPPLHPTHRRYDNQERQSNTGRCRHNSKSSGFVQQTHRRHRSRSQGRKWHNKHRK